MQWNRVANAGFSGADPSMLYLPIDPDPERPTVADQEEAPTSLLNAVRRLAALRKQHPALCADGDFIPLFAEKGSYPFVYQRTDRSSAFVIAINPSGRPVDVTFPLDDGVSLRKLLGHDVTWKTGQGGCNLRMPAISYGIFERQ